ncbi:MAG: DUF3849 domain-containing protein [Ruminococcus sp.]|jgi:hypothetical protein|nr:DUF3849 domain-containing protein [Ruminococcus sp.]
MINKAESPIYQKSAAEAAKFEETDLWRNSFKLNMEVKKAIEADASMAYHEKRGKLFLDKLVSEYGVDRPLYVLARTVKMKSEYDGRFSPEVKTIAEKYDYPDMKLKYDNTQQYVTDVHSVFVDEMVYRLTEMKGILEKQRQKEENGKKLEVTMPDDSVTVADRNSFGYTWDGMLPLSTEKAVGIYQLNDNPETRNLCFEPLKSLQDKGITPNKEKYTLVYAMDVSDDKQKSDEQLLEDVFEKFNLI